MRGEADEGSKGVGTKVKGYPSYRAMLANVTAEGRERSERPAPAVTLAGLKSHCGGNNALA